MPVLFAPLIILVIFKRTISLGTISQFRVTLNPGLQSVNNPEKRNIYRQVGHGISILSRRETQLYGSSSLAPFA